MSTNPYESPTAYSSGYGTVGAEKPVAGIVFGILNLLFGTLGICGIAFSSIMFFIPLDPDMVRQNPALQLMQDSQFYKLFMQASIVVGGVFTFVLIGAGVGLLIMKSFGRTLSLWYGIISTVLTAIVNMFIVFPALIDHMNTMPQGPAQAGAIGGIIGGIVGIVIAPIYPGLLLFFMYRPNIIAAYRGK